jgi:ATP-dependent helicase HrpA
VGYKIRFQDTTSPEAYIKVMTDGILLAEAAGDRMLSAYDTLIVDEARSGVQHRLILGYLRTLIRRRRDLRVLITSATIDTAKFSKPSTTPPSSRCPAGCSRWRSATTRRRRPAVR